MTHAFNVTHIFYMAITQQNSDQSSFFSKVFTNLEKFAGLVACIGHDLDHPGLGNTYFVKSKHHLSEMVNGQSVLEMFHHSTLKQLLV